MTAHDPRVALTEAEVDRLVFEFGDHTNIYALTDTVADLIAARLASELRQAGQDFLAHEAARGPARPAFVRHWLHARADALDAPQDAPRGPVGGEQGAEVAGGRSEGSCPGCGAEVRCALCGEEVAAR